MRKLVKILITIAVTLLLFMPVQQAAAWWGPVYGGGWRNAYIYDPAYRHAPPAVKRYIRDYYRYGPAYAELKRWRHWW